MTRNKWLAVVHFIWATLNFMAAIVELVALVVGNHAIFLILLFIFNFPASILGFLAGYYLYLEG